MLNKRETERPRAAPLVSLCLHQLPLTPPFVWKKVPRFFRLIQDSNTRAKASFLLMSDLLRAPQVDIGLSVHRHPTIWWLLKLLDHFLPHTTGAVTSLFQKKDSRAGASFSLRKVLKSCHSQDHHHHHHHLHLVLSLTSARSRLCKPPPTTPLQRADDLSPVFTFQEISLD